nr:hypothetical protein [Tanacetum cinerariifolium]
MILESVENGPLLWLTVEENGVTRSKKYFELSTTEAIQADCDVKAIILQGLPPEVYALVKENQEKDKIRSKPDKNRKRVEAGKSLKQLQWVKENQERTKSDQNRTKNGKRVEAGKSLKQLQ